MLGGDAYTGEGAKGKQVVQPTIFTGVNNQMHIAQEECLVQFYLLFLTMRRKLSQSAMAMFTG